MVSNMTNLVKPKRKGNYKAGPGRPPGRKNNRTLELEEASQKAAAQIDEAFDGDAHAFRWVCFQRSLSPAHLKAFLEGLSDFDDIEAEEKALDFVQNHSSFHEALIFLTNWPALDRAARLVLDRSREADGNHYDIFTPVADALAEKYPLAATLALRTMIDFALNQARTKRYRHAARHLMDCENLATRIEDFGAHEDHQAFEDRIRDQHGRKSSFWSLIDLGGP